MKFYRQSKDDSELAAIEVTESEARNDLDGYYKDLDLAIQTLKDGQRLQTFFAIYWAKS